MHIFIPSNLLTTNLEKVLGYEGSNNFGTQPQNFTQKLKKFCLQKKIFDKGCSHLCMLFSPSVQ